MIGGCAQLSMWPWLVNLPNFASRHTEEPRWLAGILAPKRVTKSDQHCITEEVGKSAHFRGLSGQFTSANAPRRRRAACLKFLNHFEGWPVVESLKTVEAGPLESQSEPCASRWVAGGNLSR